MMDGVVALPAFPVVLVTIGRNIITVGAFHFYSFDPPSVMIGIKPKQYSHGLLAQAGEFAVNIPLAAQLEQVELCGKLSGRMPTSLNRRALRLSPQSKSMPCSSGNAP